MIHPEIMRLARERDIAATRRFFSPNPWPLRIANAIALAAIAALLSYGAYHAVWIAATLRHL